MRNKSEWNIGVCIAKLREDRGLSQKQLSEELGKLGLNVRRETVTQWENGTRDLKTEYTIRLADFFGVSCDYILRGIDANNLLVTEETGLSNDSVNSLKKIANLKWNWKHKGITPSSILDKMIASRHFLGLIIQFYDYYVSEAAYFEICEVFAQKYREYEGGELDNIMRAAAECAAFERSPLRPEGYNLLKQRDTADFEMYRLERKIRELAEEVVTKNNGIKT